MPPILPMNQLFSWKNIENLGDLERLKLVIDYIPDEKLMSILEKNRDKGRNDYPVRAVWNSILAGVVYQHESIERSYKRVAKKCSTNRIIWLFCI